MVFSAVKSSNNNSNNNGGWGMGLLLIFFHNHPEEDELHSLPNINSNNKKRSSFSLSSSSSSNLLLSKTQSTLSICGLLVFTTLLLFTLSTFEPTTAALHHHHHHGGKSNLSRRFLEERENEPTRNGGHGRFPALQGMGELYLRGSKGMTDLIVGHVSEDTSGLEIRSFIRVLLHSGLLSRSDLVFVFPSPASASEFGTVVKSECDSLIRLVQLGAQLGRGELGPGLTRYMRPVGEGGKEPLWGKRVNSTSVGESTRPSYGSVLGFDASELDPEDSLSGFMDHVPMSLRRWACYPMLLGRVRRNFKHMMLIDVKSSLILSDPFSRVRNRTSESVYLWSNSVPATESTRHGRRNSGKAAHSQEQRSQVHPGAVLGGSRGVRRFANAALTEIVRVSIEHKGKSRNAVTESGLVNQLVRSGHLLKSINMINPTESIPDTGTLGRFNSVDSGSSIMGMSEYFSVVKRGESGSLEVEKAVMTQICESHKLFTSVYTDCLQTSLQI